MSQANTRVVYLWPLTRSLVVVGYEPTSPFSPSIPPKFVLHGLSSKSKFLAVRGKGFSQGDNYNILFSVI